MNSVKRIHFINFSRKFTISSIAFLIPLYFLELGFKGWQIGVISSLYAFAPLLFSFPTGWINDHLSIKKIIHGSLFLIAFLFIVIAHIRGFFIMLFIFLFLGIANNALDISANSFYFKNGMDRDLNEKFGLFNFWLSIGMAFGVFLGGTITYYADFKSMFFLFSAYILLVLILVFHLPETKFAHISLYEYKLDLLNTKTVLFALLIFIMALHWGAETTVYSPFLREFLHLNNFQIAFYISLPLFFLAFASFSICLLKYEAKKNEKVFLASMFISGFGHIGMVNRNILISFFFRIIHEIGDGVMAALIFVFISKLFEKRSIGGSSGVLIAIMTLGHMVGALLFSGIGYYWALEYPFIISGVLLIANTFFGAYIFSSQSY